MILRSRAIDRTVLAVALAAALAPGGCHLKTSQEDIESEVGESHYTGKLSVNETFGQSPPRRVAILPFVNKTDSTAAEIMVRQSFANHFAAKNYEDVELTVVDKKLASAGYDTAEKASAADPKELAALLHVDAIIAGEITHFDRLYALIGSMVSVGAKVRMVDGRNGETLWEAADVTRAQEGGIPTNIYEAVGKAAQAAWNMRQIGLMRASDDLFREMVKAIPEPTTLERPALPAITSLVHDSAGVTRRAGEKVQVVLYGAPSCDATFDLGSFKKAIAMRESQDGVYEGSYLVQPGDDAKDLVLKGTLDDKRGGQSEWVDALGLVSIDTKPPQQPRDLAVQPGDQSASLRWSASGDADLAGYTVYRSATPLTGYEKALETEVPEAAVGKLENGKKVYFRVTARDRAGNESEVAGPVEVRPLRHGPTPIAGTIAAGTTWYTAASPYVVKTAATLPRGATLTIEPGTEIVLESDLAIEGALAARGTAEKPIRVRGSGGAALVLRAAGPETVLAGWQARGAGLRIEGGSPVIESMTIDAAPVGITVTAGAKPTIRTSRIHGSGGHGLLVQDSSVVATEGLELAENRGDGARCEESSLTATGGRIWGNQGVGIRAIKCSASATQSSIQSNGEAGILNDASSPEPVHASENWWGSADPFEVARSLIGRVELGRILTGEPGKGQPVEVRFATSELAGPIEADTYLVAANGPFDVVGETVVSKEATLFIAPGAEVRYHAAGAKIVLDGGRIVAEGKAGAPIRFTSAKTPPHPGDYATAIEVRSAAGKPSVLKHASIRFAFYGITVNAGEVEIAYCLIRDNLQSGVRAGGTGAPKLTANTITQNRGTAGVEVSEGASPRLEGNNIFENSWAIQSGSDRFIYAERNWWGAAPPDPDRFIGNVDWEKWLESPAAEAPEAGSQPE